MLETSTTLILCRRLKYTKILLRFDVLLNIALKLYLLNLFGKDIGFINSVSQRSAANKYKDFITDFPRIN